jgi:hypothetical protein
MTSVENVRFQLRNGTATQWANANTVLLAGEPGFDITNKILKIGDGTNLWSALQSFTPGSTATGSTGSIGSTANLVNINPATGTIYGGLISGSSSFNSVNLGYGAGQAGQQQNSIAIGNQAALNNQLSRSIALGYLAGNNNQSFSSIAIGDEAGSLSQSNNSIAIGTQAGRVGQGINCIAIGNRAAAASSISTPGPPPFFIPTFVTPKVGDNTIILNATGESLNSTQSDSLFIKPIRQDPGGTNQSHFLSKIDETSDVYQSCKTLRNTIQIPRNNEYLLPAIF